MVVYLWNSGFRDGKENMMIDKALIENFSHLEKALELPVAIIRFFGWSYPSVSLGWHQKKDAFLGRMKDSQQVNIINRPTGGRALFHTRNELSFATIFRMSHPWRNSAKNIRKALILGLRYLGIQAEYVQKKRSSHEYAHDLDSNFCFSTVVSHEVQSNGKKILAMAQRRHGNILLQQGSIPLVSEQSKLVRLFQCEREEGTIRDKESSVQDLTGKHISYTFALNGFKRAFMHVFYPNFREVNDDLVFSLKLKIHTTD